jgi:copper homeostasis protein (lipoprotein)
MAIWRRRCAAEAMRNTVLRGLLITGLVCASLGGHAAGERQMSPLGLLPASFAGAGPQGARWQVDVLPGGTYQLRQQPVNGPAVDTLGRYTLEGRQLTLKGAPGAPHWTLQADGALRGAVPGLRLPRLPTPAPIEPQLTLSGLFTYMADAPRIELCADGRALPVAQAGDYLALERAYGAVRPAPGAPVWVQLRAHIAPQPAMDPAMPPVPTLTVQTFERADPKGRC